jgi:glycosyltransferase involved in cell wall biosynthesis
MDLSILVVGSENPRIRDFFSQVGRYARVSYLDASPITRLPDFKKLVLSWRWRRRGNHPPEANMLVPRRWPKISADLGEWFIRRRMNQVGKFDVIVFTWPQLCYLAERFGDVTRVYYVKDPFELWSWGADFIRPLETHLLNNVDATFAISRLLTAELAPRTPGKTFYLPNGFCDWFIPPRELPRPADLPADKPTVLSVGQINWDDYDWDYIADLAAALPDVRFCFLGRIDTSNPYATPKVYDFFKRHSSNVIWLGLRPYKMVPAYMRHSDVLFNFLKVTPLGNRRSPLRLYDYLTTERPIISTAVTEAYEHEPHVQIAPAPADAIRLIGEMLNGQHSPDLQARAEYRQNHSWDVRAREFLKELAPIIAARAHRAGASREASIAASAAEITPPRAAAV